MKKRFECIFYIALLWITLTCAQAQAGHDILFNDTDEDWIEGDFDLHDQDSLRHIAIDSGPFAIRQQLSFTKNGYGFESQSVVDYDNVQSSEIAYNVVGLYKISPGWEIYSGIELTAEMSDEGSNENSLDIDSLYALKQIGHIRHYLGVGRQEVADDRGWLINEHIDGISYIRETDRFALTGFIGSHNQALEKLIGIDEEKDDHHHNPHDNIAYARVYREIGDDKQGSAYIAYFSDKSFSQQDANWYLGLRSLGSFTDHTAYWAEAALLTGRTESGSLRAYAFDAGITHTRDDLSLRPAYTLGFAFGSGDDGSGTDSRFRQTGIHSNETVLGGVVDLKYYGQVLDPQLSNLQIVTLGFGIRPRERFSIDLLYNGYWQIHPSTTISTDGIEINPNGTDHYIGSELDLVIGIINRNQLSISLMYGRFLGSDDVNADVGSLEFMWNLF